MCATRINYRKLMGIDYSCLSECLVIYLYTTHMLFNVIALVQKKKISMLLK